MDIVNDRKGVMAVTMGTRERVRFEHRGGPSLPLKPMSDLKTSSDESDLEDAAAWPRSESSDGGSRLEDDAEGTAAAAAAADDDDDVAEGAAVVVVSRTAAAVAAASPDLGHAEAAAAAPDGGCRSSSGRKAEAEGARRPIEEGQE